MTDKYYESEIEITDESKNRTAKKVNIKWLLEVEHRSWGVKSLCVTVPNQTLNVWFEQENADTGDYDVVETTVDIKDCDVEFDIVHTGETIYPSELIIADGKYTLVF